MNVSLILKLFGTFARGLISTGLVCGRGRRQAGGGRSPFPAVKAYIGPLPAGTSGIEFTTPILPTSGSPPQAIWPLDAPGVISKDGGDLACIPVVITKAI